MDRTVYILLTRSGTCFSRLIHLATADDYTHVSIGLEGPLGTFYSFSRKHRYFALPAGFVEERVHCGGFQARPQMPCCLYRLQVSQEVYQRIQRRLEEMNAQKELYHYNILGAFACFFNLSLRREHHFFCSQFVANLLQDCGALDFPKTPDLTRPADFCSFEELEPIHRGVIGEIYSSAVA